MTAKEYNLAVDQFADGIYRFALRHLKNEMSAKDIVQETYTRVWIKHEDISFEKAKSYLFTTAYHAIVDWFKTEKRGFADGPIAEVAGTTSSPTVDLQEILHEALETLPIIQKTVVLLRDYEGYNYGEIAEIAGLNEAQVKVYIFRARKALQAYIRRIDLVV
jgi:RNA polymerase sigma-70 factor (ECF subfamily)